MKDFPQFLKDLVSCSPQTGEGVHQWLYNVARQLHQHRSTEDIFALLRASADGCGRHVPDSEITDAITNSKGTAWRPQGAPSTAPRSSAPPRWPECNDEQREAVIDAQGMELTDLWETSPIRLDETGPNTEDIVDQLFPADCWLCCGISGMQFACRKREDWRGKLAGQALLVPSPMTGKFGTTKSGQKTSEHTLDNTGPRRFLITEFDSGTPDEQASIIGHLSASAPLAMVVHSGKKSLHAWWWVDGEEERDVFAFFRSAVVLGADRATWTRSQFVRMPFGLRDNGRRQLCHYFNPNAIAA